MRTQKARPVVKCDVQGASRSISVELRTTARADAPVVETIRLYAKSHALVVGIDTYTDGWGRLNQTRKDARAGSPRR